MKPGTCETNSCILADVRRYSDTSTSSRSVVENSTTSMASSLGTRSTPAFRRIVCPGRGAAWIVRHNGGHAQAGSPSRGGVHPPGLRLRRWRSGLEDVSVTARPYAPAPDDDDSPTRTVRLGRDP